MMPIALLAGLLFANVDVATVLKKADDNAVRFTDLKMTTTMVVDDQGSTKTAKFETFQKGEKRFVKFLAPADAKGMAVLIEEGGSSFVYLPQFQKVRRIAGHQKSQGLMDSDFSNEDMGSSRFAGGYDATLVDATDKVARLKMTPKAGTESEYESLVVSVDLENFVYIQIEYFVSGKAVKRQTRSDIKKVTDDFFMPSSILMEDLTRPHKTTLTLDNVAANSGLADSLFTKQALERQR